MGQPKVLILSGENSPYRAVLKKALKSSYEVSFISAISEISVSIGAFKPDLFIHDWTATDTFKVVNFISDILKQLKKMAVFSDDCC